MQQLKDSAMSNFFRNQEETRKRTEDLNNALSEASTVSERGKIFLEGTPKYPSKSDFTRTVELQMILLDKYDGSGREALYKAVGEFDEQNNLGSLGCAKIYEKANDVIYNEAGDGINPEILEKIDTPEKREAFKAFLEEEGFSKQEMIEYQRYFEVSSPPPAAPIVDEPAVSEVVSEPPPAAPTQSTESVVRPDPDFEGLVIASEYQGIASTVNANAGAGAAENIVRSLNEAKSKGMGIVDRLLEMSADGNDFSGMEVIQAIVALFMGGYDALERVIGNGNAMGQVMGSDPNNDPDNPVSAPAASVDNNFMRMDTSFRAF